MRITRLKLENWRNFRKVDVALGDRTFFIGPNASGKSNLLEAVRFLRDVSATTNGGLQTAVATREGVPAIRCLAARRASDIQIIAEIGDQAGSQWRYELSFTGEARTGRPVVRRETVVRVTPESETVIVDRPSNEDHDDPERLTETHLEQTGANRDFREIAEFFRSVRYLHAVPQIIRDPDRRSDNPDDPFGSHLLTQINAAPKREREARLRRINDVLKVAAPQLNDLQLDHDDSGAPHLKAKYLHWRPQGAWQREDQFSDGTLRLIGLIWSLAERGGPLLLEEPELSLHAAVVTQLASVIRRASRRAKGASRQTLVTTHSHELLSDPGVGLDEVFVLRPGPEGTEVLSPSTMPDIRAMVEREIPLPEAVMPLTRPAGVEDLPLFVERPT
ncbi:MAG: chromosome segregation protein SMC [Rhodobacteraceae bacterium]|nr:MAG: chromosome segregation protein SMC [Paracoccaceae bacterium]